MRIKALTSREVVTGNQILQLEEEKWDGYIYDFTSILEANLDPDEMLLGDTALFSQNGKTRQRFVFKK